MWTTSRRYRNISYIMQYVYIKQLKYQFLEPSVSLLEHHTDTEGINLFVDKLKVIVHVLTLESVQELHSFFGLINYHGKFLATILAP